MKLHNFITLEEIEQVTNCVKEKKDFKVEKGYKKYRFRIGSRRAAVDFENGTKKGDYIVTIGFSTTDSGNGMPISSKGLEELATIDKCRNYIDTYLGSQQMEGYGTIDVGQISFFS